MSTRAAPVHVFTRSLTVLALSLAGMVCAALAQGATEAQQELAAAKRRTADIGHGAQLFRTCAGCHGVDGAGIADGRVPRIAGQHATVLMKQLVDFRNDHRWDPQMEHFADWTELPDAQAIADVAGYINGLSGNSASGKGNGEMLGRGARRYSQLCLRCHGAHGEGDAPHAMPRVAGQHFGYVERQIYDAVDGRRPNFSVAHVRLLARLDRDDIEAVADYISRLEGATRPPDPGHRSH